jgi:hypothetical protein
MRYVLRASEAAQCLECTPATVPVDKVISLIQRVWKGAARFSLDAYRKDFCSAPAADTAAKPVCHTRDRKWSLARIQQQHGAQQ